jgi:hypothetical protein
LKTDRYKIYFGGKEIWHSEKRVLRWTEIQTNKEMDRQRNGKTDIKTEKNAKTERNTEVEIDFGETEK